jgi:hypothetical protein
VKKTGKFLFSLVSLLLMVFFSVQAQAILSVQSTVDTTQTAVNEGITLTVSVISSESVEIEPPRLADLDGFRLDNTWDSTAVSQKMVSTPSGMDWESQRRKDFNFLLTPMRAGRLTIPALDLKVSGKVFHTQPLVIEVAENSNGGGGGGHQGRQNNRQRQQKTPLPPGFNWPGANSMEDIDRLEEEMFNQLLNRQGQRAPPPGAGGGEQGGLGRPRMVDPQYRTLPSNPNEAFFVQVEVDKTEVYEGEQITASWYIYTRGQMESLDRVKFPDLHGFWKEIIEEVPSIQFTEEIVNGVPYRKALIASHALFPIKPGTAVIDEYKIKSRVRMPLQNGMGFSASNEYTRSSDRVNIKVKPLPTEGRPQDFAGAVGQFEVQTSVDGQKFPVNQPFNFRIRFEGYGNAKMIDLPAIQWPSTVEIYDTKTESKFFKDGHSYKQFDILMIPRQQGILHIPEFTVSLFDATSKKYYQKKTAAVDLEVTENTQAPSGAMAQGAQGKPTAPEIKGPQLPPLIGELQTGNPILASTGNPLALGGAYLLILFGLMAKARRELGWGQRKKSLQELVERRFKKVETALKANDHKKVGSELMNVFYFLLGEATGEGGAVQEIDRLLDRVPPSVRRDLGETLKKSFEFFQVLSFAPDEMVKKYAEPQKLKETVNDARQLSQKLLSALTSETPQEKS